MATKPTPWIICDFADGKSGRCTRCGEELEIGLPQRLEVWIAAVREFCKLHSRCTERKAGA